MAEKTTLDQLSKNSKDYYEQSTKNSLYEYVYLGKDYFGRKVYQKYFDNKEYDSPRALLTYREFVNNVKEWAKLCNSIGVERWTKPYYERIRKISTSFNTGDKRTIRTLKRFGVNSYFFRF